jgi:precorrin-6A/cobalt-precorrin-6A reductase
MTRTLILGGTTEASQLARAMQGRDAVFSYAGRTEVPVAQPLPTRIGGFGGVDGLVAYLRAENITAVVDATHPFAAQMSRNAIDACTLSGVPLLTLQRSAWTAQTGDTWQHVASIEAAIDALPDVPARVFLAIGKQNLAGFSGKPHHYLLRLVDRPESPPLPDCTVVLARGPFDVAGDKALLLQHNITHIVAKNAGGVGAAAKLTAARDLGLPAILIDRPKLPERQVVGTVAEVMAWLDHTADRGV